MYSQRPSRSRKILVGSLGILFGLSHLALIQSTVNKKYFICKFTCRTLHKLYSSVSEKGYASDINHSPKIIEMKSC